MNKDNTGQTVNEVLARTWKEATENGDKQYFTGKPCKYGHVDVRFTATRKCRECCRIRSRKYEERKRASKPQKIKIRLKDDPEYRKERAKKWKIENPEKYKESYKKTYERKKSTAKGKLEYALSSGVRRGIIKGSKYGRRTFDLLGYTLEDLMKHLETGFRKGMTWDNYGEWHIDHIIPLAAFNYETPDDPDFARAWALENLQPLWAMENWTKNAKMDAPFQPSLLLRPANDNFKESAPTSLTNL